ncbi:MAG: PAS domain-containing protein [Bryobacteraceae bacterium]
MKRRKAKQNPRPAARNRQVNIHLPPHLDDQVHAINQARLLTDSRSTCSRIHQDALEAYLPSVDMKTGLPRPSSGEPALTVVPPYLPLFHRLVDFNHFDNDSLLYRAVDESGLLCWIAGADVSCLHVSPMLATFAGRPVAAFLGRGWPEIIHPEDREGCMRTCLEKFPKREPFLLAYRLRFCNGTYVWVIDHAQPRRRPDGAFAGYIGVLYQAAKWGAAPDGAQASAFAGIARTS